MYLKADDLFRRFTCVIAGGICLVFFLLFQMAATPLLNSGDDAYFMYTLSGGFGEKPSALLHYNFGWHYWLGSIVKYLFSLYPGFNWYGFFLNLYHFTGCTAVLYVLLKRQKIVIALFFFLILFFFIEMRLLLSLGYTGAAWVMAAGALLLLVHAISGAGKKYRTLILPSCMLILAGMLRVQIAWLVVLLFLPIAFTILTRKKSLKWAGIAGMLIICIWGLNKIHEAHYRHQIPGWTKQEDFRQAMFYAYNRPVSQRSLTGLYTDSTEQQLFAAGFLYDSAHFTNKRIYEITRSITRKRLFNEPDDTETLYWVFKGMRIYILLFGLFIASLILQKRRKAVINWLICLLSVMVLYGILFVYLKITYPVYMGLLLLLWLQLAMQYEKKDPVFMTVPAAGAQGLFMFLCFFWMGAIVFHENKINLQHQAIWVCKMNELKKHPQELFVATDDNFPLGWVYIWEKPGNWPAANLLYKDRLLTHSYPLTLQRFGIIDLYKAIAVDKRVLLLGGPLKALEQVMPGTKLSPVLDGYGCFEVRRLNAALSGIP